jgi:hypothetical protein
MTATTELIVFRLSRLWITFGLRSGYAGNHEQENQITKNGYSHLPNSFLLCFLKV